GRHRLPGSGLRAPRPGLGIRLVRPRTAVTLAPRLPARGYDHAHGRLVENEPVANERRAPLVVRGRAVRICPPWRRRIQPALRRTGLALSDSRAEWTYDAKADT